MQNRSDQIESVAVKLDTFFTHRLFEETSRSFPHRTAICFGSEHISYDFLNKICNRNASILKGISVGKEDIIGIAIEEGAFSVIALLSIFKAGGVFVPFDIRQVRAKLEVSMKYSPPRLMVVTPGNLKSVLELIADYKLECGHVLIIDGVTSVLKYRTENGWTDVDIEDANYENPSLQNDPDDGNYIYYTSGSTGTPKGVLGSHRSLSHFIHWERSLLKADEHTRTSQLIQPLFDASLRDIFLPLTSGGTLCMPSFAQKSNLQLLCRWITREMVTVIHYVPTMMRAILDQIEAHPGENFPALKFLLLSGEELFEKDITRWQRVVGESTTIYNLYGATETTLIKSFYKVTELTGQPGKQIPIGKGIANAEILVINANRKCVIGEVGDVYIKSRYVTKGYYQNQQLTSEVFVQNPIGEPGDIVYRTGDLGRYLKGGIIELAGRHDDQIKLNGVRVNLSEVEQAFNQIKEINDIAVIAFRNNNDQLELAAYYTSGITLNTTQLYQQLQLLLPAHLIPAQMKQLPAMPLGRTGKIDRKALPLPNPVEEKQPEKSGSFDADEKTIADIWSTVLKRDVPSDTTTFFELGGTSMKAIVVISRLHAAFGVSIALRDLLQNPTVKQLKAIIKKDSGAIIEKISALEEQEYYEPSFGQRQLWIVNTLMPSDAYNICMAHVVRGKLNILAFKEAVRAVVASYEILRTKFFEVEGHMKQVVVPAEQMRMDSYLFEHREALEKDHIQELVDRQVQRIIPLDKCPLFRISIHGEGELFVVAFSIHHIICDDRSLDLIFERFTSIYNDINDGREPSKLKLDIQFRDYAASQAREIATGKWNQSKTYWKECFEKQPPRISFRELPHAIRQLPIDKNTLEHRIEPDELEVITQLCKEWKITPLVFFTSSIAVLLACASNLRDIVVGLPTYGRNNDQLEKQVGCYVNTVPLRMFITPHEMVSEFVSKVRESVIGAVENRHYPFDLLVQDLGLSGAEGNPLFNVMVVWQEDSVGNKLEWNGIDMQTVLPVKLNSKFELSFVFTDNGRSVQTVVEYNTSRFNRETISQLMEVHRTIVKRMITARDMKLSDLLKIDAGFAQLDRTQDSEAIREIPIDFLRKQANLNPSKIALIHGNVHLTFHKLNVVANYVASQLVNRFNVEKGDRIGVHLDRSDKWIILLAAIWKVGACYVPIDKQLPRKRMERMLHDFDPRLLISDDTSSLEITSVKMLSLDSLGFEGEEADFFVPVTPEDLSYIMYTSGTTGDSKGVLIENKDIASLAQEQNSGFGVTETERISQITSSSFDVSLSEILMSFAAGVPCVLLDQNKVSDSRACRSEIERQCITLLTLTPSMLSLFDRYEFSSVRTIVSGGETPNPTDLRFYAASKKYINAYGPTECTVCASFQTQDSLDNTRISIGQPLAGQRILILNDDGTPVYRGAEGVIHVGGQRIARGYLNKPELTHEMFVNDEFNTNGRLYRTGDIGFIDATGRLVYVGRTDTQVKINGRRIDLESIRSQLLDIPGVRDAFVMKSTIGYEGIHAFVVSNGITQQEIKDNLMASLPLYMIPNHIEIVLSLPLNINGKIDVQMLTEKHSKLPLQLEVVDTGVESTGSKVKKIWRTLLTSFTGGDDESFFKYGGNSLVAIRMISRVNEMFHTRINLKAFFAVPTISNLVRLISVSNQKNDVLNAFEEQDHFPISKAQLRLWIASQASADQTLYNCTIAYEVDGMEVSVFVKAIHELVSRHEVLRSRFVNVGDAVRQHTSVSATGAYHVELRDWSSIPIPERLEKWRKLGHEESQHIFDLQAGPLLRVVGATDGEQVRYVLLNLHHIITDAWSMQLIASEFQRIYNSLSGKKQLPPTTESALQYHDYSIWESSRDISPDEIFWQTYLDAVDGRILPNFTASAPEQLPREAYLIINKTIRSELAALASRFDTTLSNVMLALCALYVNTMSGQNSFLIGVGNANRNKKELESIIGFFVNILPLKISIHADDDFDVFMANIKENMSLLLEHTNYPYDTMVEKFGVRAGNKRELLNVSYNYLSQLPLNNEDQEETEGMESEEMTIGQTGRSKFDTVFSVNDSQHEISVKIQCTAVTWDVARFPQILSSLIDAITGTRK
jgi:amino acid adenylation domain-containing protein